MNERNLADHIQKWITKLKKSNKSKTAFKTLLCALSKFAEQAKMHLKCVFKMVEYMVKSFILRKQFFSEVT